jgi:hypothetical protein
MFFIITNIFNIATLKNFVVSRPSTGIGVQYSEFKFTFAFSQIGVSLQTPVAGNRRIFLGFRRCSVNFLNLKVDAQENCASP